MIKDMVVSAYMEDVSWVRDALATNEIRKVHIYNKGDKEIKFSDGRIKVRKVDNVGREGETFLRHIIENYESLPSGLWFVQGNPFEHSPDFIGLVKNASHYQSLPFKSMTTRYKVNVPPRAMEEINNAFWVSGMRCAEYFISESQIVGHCCFEDAGARFRIDQFSQKYRTRDTMGYLSCRLGLARPGPITAFAYGACFFVSGSCIRRHPIWVYEEARKFLLESHSQGSFQGYILERFWPYLLTGVSFDSLTDCYKGIIRGPSAVWCSRRKKIWFKDENWSSIIQKPDSVVIYYDKNDIRRLAGIDIVGRDKNSADCPSLKMADDIFLEEMNMAGRWGEYFD